jgi:hypothetical protein
MKKLILVSAFAAAIIPSIALAQMTLPTTIPAGTVVCRPAKASEKSNATMGTTQLMCRAVDVTTANASIKKIRAMMAQQKKTAPVGAATPDPSMQAMLQEQAKLNAQFHVPVILGGNGGVED